MAILRKVAHPHKCEMPTKNEQKTLYIGSVWRCDVCMAVHVVVDMDLEGMPIWVESEQYLDGFPSEKDILDLAEKEVEMYGLIDADYEEDDAE